MGTIFISMCFAFMLVAVNAETDIGCDDYHCGERCSGDGCAAECSSDYCGFVCKGDDCAAECSGDSCGRNCYGDGCAAKCSGRDCGMRCSGDNCACECTGDNCGKGCTGKNCGPGAVCPTDTTEANTCTCKDGTAATASDCKTNGAMVCTICNDGYTLNNQVCEATAGLLLKEQLNNIYLSYKNDNLQASVCRMCKFCGFGWQGSCTDHCSQWGWCGTTSGYTDGGTDCTLCDPNVKYLTAGDDDEQDKTMESPTSANEEWCAQFEAVGATNRDEDAGGYSKLVSNPAENCAAMREGTAGARTETKDESTSAATSAANTHDQKTTSTILNLNDSNDHMHERDGVLVAVVVLAAISVLANVVFISSARFAGNAASAEHQRGPSGSLDNGAGRKFSAISEFDDRERRKFSTTLGNQPRLSKLSVSEI